MVCHPFQAVGVQADEAYTRKMTGVDQKYKERYSGWFSCPKCGKYLARGSLATHFQTQNVATKGVTA